MGNRGSKPPLFQGRSTRKTSCGKEQRVDGYSSYTRLKPRIPLMWIGIWCKVYSTLFWKKKEDKASSFNKKKIDDLGMKIVIVDTSSLPTITKTERRVSASSGAMKTEQISGPLKQTTTSEKSKFVFWACIIISILTFICVVGEIFNLSYSDLNYYECFKNMGLNLDSFNADNFDKTFKLYLIAGCIITVLSCFFYLNLYTVHI